MAANFRSSFPTLFWDVADVDDDTHSQFIIERVLEMGTAAAIKLLFETYSEDAIRQAIISSNRISPKTALFWQVRLNITEAIKCIQKQSMPMLKDHWNY